MIPQTLPEIIYRVLILLIVFPAHELAHALAATRMGDPTPREHGRLTLNPFKHLDLYGSLMFIIAGIGWASTPINPANFGENRRLKLGLVSLAGPATNLLRRSTFSAGLRRSIPRSPPFRKRNTSSPCSSS
jgi:Zn-dependent protease